MRSHLAPLAALACALAVPAVGATPARWEEFRGLPIVDVRVHAGDVFDPSRPGEDHFFCRWANALHIRTRAQIIRRELLVGPGDRFDPERAAESERNLRALDIFQDVALQPEVEAEGLVVHVRTSDRWTTEVRTELSRQGGISQVGVGISDVNLLGRAFELGGSVTSSSDVDAASVRWRDPRVLGTRFGGSVALRRDDLEDGDQFTLDRPFYSETVRFTASLAYVHARGARRRFEAGSETERIEVDDRLADGFVAWHARDAWLSRWALLVSRRRQDGAGRRDDAGVAAVTWAALARRYDVVRDVDLLGAVEDVATGFTVQIGAGADLRALGSSRDRAFLRTDLGFAQPLGATALCGFSLRQYGFFETMRLGNARTAFEAFGYWQTPGVQTLAFRAGGAALVREPADLRYNLGGDDRLRGYEARHLSGERILYLGVEERLFTPWRIFFLRLGAVVFVDAAVAWDAGEPLSRDDGRVGSGFGLRIASNRAGSSLAGIDVAFGNDGVQFSLASGQWFRVARGLSYLDPRPFR